MTQVTIGNGVTYTPPKRIAMSVDEYIQGRYNIPRSELSPKVRMLVDRLESYVVKMAPNAAKTKTSIVESQKILLNTISGILSCDLSDAITAWEILLFVAKKYDFEIFNERTINQHYDELPSNQQLYFTTLTALIIGTADAGMRQLFLRNYPIANVLLRVPNEKQRENLVAIYASLTAR